MAEEKGNARPSRIERFREFVGKVPDSAIAAKAGVTPSAVKLYRTRLGIAAAVPQGERWGDRPLPAEFEAMPAETKGSRSRKGRGRPRKAAAAPAAEPAKRGPRSKLDPFRDVIGIESDAIVAEKAGVSRSAVQMYRAKHGIKRSGATGGRKPRASAPAAAAAPARAPKAERAPARRSGGSLHAWKLTLSGRGGDVVRYAVASDAASACGLADGVGEVVAIERVGEALG